MIADLPEPFQDLALSMSGLIKRHLKPTAKNPQGGILEKEAPLHASKVMPVDPKTGKPTRVKFGTDSKGKKIRLAVKSGEEIPNKSREATRGSAE